MREINNDIVCIVLFKYEHTGSDEQEIIFVWSKLGLIIDLKSY